MNELVNLVVTKTGIPQATAQKAVDVVINYLKQRLPAPVGAQIDAFLANPGAMQQAEGMAGKVSSMFGKKK